MMSTALINNVLYNETEKLVQESLIRFDIHQQT